MPQNGNEVSVELLSKQAGEFYMFLAVYFCTRIIMIRLAPTVVSATDAVSSFVLAVFAWIISTVVLV